MDVTAVEQTRLPKEPFTPVPTLRIDLPSLEPDRRVPGRGGPSFECLSTLVPITALAPHAQLSLSLLEMCPYTWSL